MMTLRALTWLVSFALHGAIAGFFLISPGGASLEEGIGEDTFIVEQGVLSERVEAVEIRHGNVDVAHRVTAAREQRREKAEVFERDVTQRECRRHRIPSERGGRRWYVL